MTTYTGKRLASLATFDDLRAAVQDCTSYDLVQRMGDDYEEFVLVDPYGDIDGDVFYELEDVESFIRNNDDVDRYLYGMTK
jgi:hypothetical protein